MKIYLPNDAEGNVIPSNVKVMYEKDGTVRYVDDLIYLAISKKWRVSSGPLALRPSELYLNKPDSLKQLVEDLNRAWDVSGKGCMYMPCYYDKDRGEHCNDCRLNSHGKMMCLDAMMADIVSRVNLLAGDSE